MAARRVVRLRPSQVLLSTYALRIGAEADSESVSTSRTAQNALTTTIAEQLSKSKQASKGIAIVDDEVSLCSVFSLLVKSLGYEMPFAAHDGTEIVRAVLGGTVNPDLIIMDYRMPIMNGMDAAERILKEKPETRIIIASADDSIRAAAHSAGLLFAQKPFSVTELAQMIKDALQVSQ